MKYSQLKLRDVIPVTTEFYRMKTIEGHFYEYQDSSSK